LYRHLAAHPEFRAGIDPWWGEDFKTGTFLSRFPFWELPNFVAMPHSAGLGPSTDERAVRFAVQRLAEYFATGETGPTVDRAEYEP
jgi:phosphoglycerate dehydrogenase-like enzyme